MLKKMLGWKMMGLYVATLALGIAARFGYRCPAQGCPACRMMGHH